MRRVLGVSVIALVLMATGASAASADGSATGDEGVTTQQGGGDGGAVVTKFDRSCGVPLPNSPIGLVYQGSGTAVVTPSGNVTFRCRTGVQEQHVPGETVHQDFRGCDPGAVTLTRGGQLQLVCHIHPG